MEPSTSASETAMDQIDAPSRTFSLTRQDAILLTIVGVGGGGFFLVFCGLVLASAAQDKYWPAAVFGIFGIGVLLYAVSLMVIRVELRGSAIVYHGLFGQKQIQLGEVTTLHWRGNSLLSVLAPNGHFTISNQNFTGADLDTIAEFIYAGAEAASNKVLKRPIPQLRLKDIPQKTAKDFMQR